MFNILKTNRAFVQMVLEEGMIRFVVRGELICDAIFGFDFADTEIHVSPPNLRTKLLFRDELTEESTEYDAIHFYDVEGEVVFPGHIGLPERSEQGIIRALNILEIWADLICLVSGNPKVQIELQIPYDYFINFAYVFKSDLVGRWEALAIAYRGLTKEQRKPIARALWWYRKGCSAKKTSIFSAFTAYWNCLEILCGVSGNKLRKEHDTDKKIEEYLRSKGSEPIRASDIAYLYNNVVSYSIPSQVKDALASTLGHQVADEWIFYCFYVKPAKESLYQIRNDINHGNIRENEYADFERVYWKLSVLQTLIVDLLYRKIRKRTNVHTDIHGLVKQIKENSTLPS